jgi:hypothetical protein
MPTIPEGDSRSSAGSGKSKRKPKPTSKAKNRKQKIKKKYAKAREDAQLAGIIPTTPDGAVKNERVQPFAQTLGPALPEIVRQALKDNWATPDSAKPAIIASLLEAFYKDDIVLDENGKEVRVKPSRKLLMELAKTLHLLDQTQWERDHPAEAGKAKGGGMGGIGVAVSVDVQSNIQAAALIRKMIEDGELGYIEEVPASSESCTSSTDGLTRQMEASTPPSSD